MNYSKRAKLKLLFGLLFFFCAAMITAQQRTITGVVKDTSGEPVIGANVMVKNTTIGAATDFDGNYSLAVPANAKTLTVSYIVNKPKVFLRLVVYIAPAVRCFLVSLPSVLQQVFISHLHPQPGYRRRLNTPSRYRIDFMGLVRITYQSIPISIFHEMVGTVFGRFSIVIKYPSIHLKLEPFTGIEDIQSRQSVHTL